LQRPSKNRNDIKWLYAWQAHRLIVLHTREWPVTSSVIFFTL
ncbi:hypothetical protein T4A_5962, partial [Trichinella pseudospiralis]